MNYAVAKKLKDLGFSQKEGKYLYGNLINDVTIPTEFNDSVYVPTLSELIEACGNEFGDLALVEVTKASTYFEWRACNRNGGNDRITGKGKTPEEAVANLWRGIKINRQE